MHLFACVGDNAANHKNLHFPLGVYLARAPTPLLYSEGSAFAFNDHFRIYIALSGSSPAQSISYTNGLVCHPIKQVFINHPNQLRLLPVQIKKMASNEELL
jgi:hypothetical protein